MDGAAEVKIVRCPAVDMATWALEVGDIAEPRLASEVLPGASTVTVSLRCCVNFS